ncbi:MAG: type II secretion system F family protein [Oscillochloridaceae bacterium umkhey_bin13]
MHMDLLVIVSIGGSLSILLLVLGLAQLRQSSELSDRLNLSLGGPIAEPRSEAERLLRKPFRERVVRPIIAHLSRFIGWFWPENRVKALQVRINLAGSPGGLRATEFIGLRLVTGLLFTGLSVLFLSMTPPGPQPMLLATLFALCGFLLPDLWLSRRITERRQAILNTLPDALDLLTITTEAGLSFESGMQEIMDKWDNEIAGEFARVLRDVGMGQSRRYALNQMAERTGVPDVQSFVAALNQAEELGVSIGRVLRTQSDDLRTRRRQRAYEKANQVPVKVMFPLVFLIFPAIFVVLLGPALPQLLALGN